MIFKFRYYEAKLVQQVMRSISIVCLSVRTCSIGHTIGSISTKWPFKVPVRVKLWSHILLDGVNLPTLNFHVTSDQFLCDDDPPAGGH